MGERRGRARITMGNVTHQPTATDGDRSCAKKGPRVRSAAWGLPPTVAGAEVTPQGRLRVGEQAIELSCRLFLVGAANRRVNISSTWQRGARTPRRRAMRGNGEEPLIALHAARLWHHADVDLTLGLEGPTDSPSSSSVFGKVPVSLHDCDRCLGGRFRTTPTVEFGAWTAPQPPPLLRQFGSV